EDERRRNGGDGDCTNDREFEFCHDHKFEECERRTGGGGPFSRRKNRESQGRWGCLNRMGGDGGDESGRGNCCAMPDKKGPQFFHGAIDAHLGGVLARAKVLADLSQALIVKKSEDNRMPIFFVQASYGGIEQWGDLMPVVF